MGTVLITTKAQSTYATKCASLHVYLTVVYDCMCTRGLFDTLVLHVEIFKAQLANVWCMECAWQAWSVHVLKLL